MKKFTIFISIFLITNVFGQTKITFSNTESLLKEIKPDKSVNSWMLVSSEYGREKVIKSSNKLNDYAPQDSGFQLVKNDDQFYYIVYLEGSTLKYIKNTDNLKSFLGTIDSPEEAAILGILDGYILDEEFKNLAGNYVDKKDSYAIELGKITTTSCPFAKNHYELTINKKSGKITSVKDNGVYNEVFDKSCANNPHNSMMEKQMEAAEAARKERFKKVKIKIKPKRDQR